MAASLTRRYLRRWPVAALALFAAWLAAGPALARSLPDFADLAEQVSPAVVNIGTRVRAAGGPDAAPSLPGGAPFDELLRRFFGEHGMPGARRPRSSLGSGFIISEDGYVLSNYHVVKDADEVVVRLSDRREFEAEVVGSDERSDLALLKIDADHLPVVKIGDSRKLRPGEWVLAIGSPFGFEHSITAGIVSATGRSLPNESYTPFIQTDVAINPGNSGGPLFNMDGEVVGVNSQIYSRTGGFMGLSFAIPIHVAMDVYRQLRDHGKVSRGWLGVLIQDVTQDLAESFGMKRPRGALVSRVLPDSPAAAAGMQPGDVILRFHGQPVETSSALPPLVGEMHAGEEAEAEVLRQGHVKRLRVTVGELPPEERIAEVARSGGAERPPNRLNVVVRDLGEEQRRELGVEDHGVLVEAVGDGPAADAGLERGDVVLRLDGQPVRSASQFDELVSRLPAGKSVAMLIQRRDGPLFLAMKLPDEE